MRWINDVDPLLLSRTIHDQIKVNLHDDCLVRVSELPVIPRRLASLGCMTYPGPDNSSGARFRYNLLETHSWGRGKLVFDGLYTVLFRTVAQ